MKFVLLILLVLFVGCSSASLPEAELVEVVPEPGIAPELLVEDVPFALPDEDLSLRINSAYDLLHGEGSASLVRADFPDLELVYTDDGADCSFCPAEILPFKYYYSEEADMTFNLCNVDRSVFICAGRMENKITREDVLSGRCEVTPIYRLSLGV